jgi:hypothetical protein
LKSLGRIACAEDGSPRAAVLAMGEAAGESPARAARLLMQEFGDPDATTEDDDGPVPPCMYQPGQPATPSCPGFTRWPGDDDGDGTCLLATRGCNGYRAVQSDEYQPPWQFNEGPRMPDDGAGADPAPTTPQTPQQPVQPAQAPVNPTPQTPAQPGVAPNQPAGQPPVQPTPPAQGQADDREAQVIRAAEVRTLENRIKASEARAEAAETRLAAAEKRLRDMDMAERIGRIGDRLAMCLRTGRIDRVEHERLTQPEHMVKFAEGDALEFVLQSIEARPAGATIPMGEIGSGAVPSAVNSAEAGQRITAKANEIMAEAAKSGQRMTYTEAAKQAARLMPDAATAIVRGNG